FTGSGVSGGRQTSEYSAARRVPVAGRGFRGNPPGCDPASRAAKPGSCTRLGSIARRLGGGRRAAGLASSPRMGPDGRPPVFCPQCGAPAPFRGTTVSLVCEYCNSTIVRTGVDFSLVGRVSALVDSGSPILLGSRGRYKGVPFEVTGRLQVTYARGTWNEWFVEFADGSTGWLAD